MTSQDGIHFKHVYIVSKDIFIFGQVIKIRSVSFITDTPDGPVTICQCNLTSQLNTRSKSGANVISLHGGVTDCVKDENKVLWLIRFC